MKNRLFALLTLVLVAAVLPVKAMAAQKTDLKDAMAKKAGADLNDWIVTDMDGDKKDEALATYFDKKGTCHIMFSDSEGNCSEICKGKLPTDPENTFVNEIKTGSSSDVIIYVGSGRTGKEVSLIIGMEDKKPYVLFEGNGCLNEIEDALMLTTTADEKSYNAKKEQFSGSSTRLTFLEKYEGKYREMPGRLVNGYDRYTGFDKVSEYIYDVTWSQPFDYEYENLETIVRPNGWVVVGVNCISENGDAECFYFKGKEKKNSKTGEYELEIRDDLRTAPGRAVVATQYKAPKRAENLNLVAVSDDGSAALYYDGPKMGSCYNEWVTKVYLSYNNKLILVPNPWFTKYGATDIEVEVADYDKDGSPEVAISMCDEGGTGHKADDLTIIDNLDALKNINKERLDVYIYSVDYEEEYDYSDDYGNEDTIGDKCSIGYEYINPAKMLEARLKTNVSKDKHRVDVSDKKTGKSLGYLKNTKTDRELDTVYWEARTEVVLNGDEIHFDLEPADPMGLIIPDYIGIDMKVKYMGDGKLEVDTVSATQKKYDLD